MAKIIVYCGDDIISSRKAFLEHLQSLKDQDFDIQRIFGKDLTEEQLELFSGPVGLFGQKRCLAIEGLLSLPKSREKNKILEIVKLLDCYLVDWETKEFSKSEQQKLGQKFVFKNFKLPEVLFKFLDKLSPSKTSENLRMFRLAIETVDPAFVFLMLARQIRLLILASENNLSGLPSWQSQKLFSQAKLFEKTKLCGLYQKLLDIDFHQKTSRSAFSLVSVLDLLMTEI